MGDFKKLMGVQEMTEIAPRIELPDLSDQAAREAEEQRLRQAALGGRSSTDLREAGVKFTKTRLG